VARAGSSYCGSFGGGGRQARERRVLIRISSVKGGEMGEKNRRGTLGGCVPKMLLVRGGGTEGVWGLGGKGQLINKRGGGTFRTVWRRPLIIGPSKHTEEP